MCVPRRRLVSHALTLCPRRPQHCLAERNNPHKALKADWFMGPCNIGLWDLVIRRRNATARRPRISNRACHDECAISAAHDVDALQASILAAREAHAALLAKRSTIAAERDQLAVRTAKLEHIVAEMRLAMYGRRSERIVDDRGASREGQSCAQDPSARRSAARAAMTTSTTCRTRRWRSRRFIMRHTPGSSHHSSFTRSVRLARTTWTAPEYGSAASASCTGESAFLRKSTGLVAS